MVYELFKLKPLFQMLNQVGSHLEPPHPSQNKWKKIAQRCLQIQIPKARSHTPNQHFKATTQDAKIMKWYGFNGLDVRMENPTASKISYRFSIGIVKSAGCYYPFCVLFVSIYSWKFIIIIVVNLFFPIFPHNVTLVLICQIQPLDVKF